MLLRALSRLPRADGERFALLLEAAGVVTSHSTDVPLRIDRLPPADLVVVDGRRSDVEIVASISAARAHRDHPEVLVIVEGDDAKRRARFLAAGCFAVLDGRLGDGELGPAIEGLISRLRPARERIAILRRRERLLDEGDAESHDPAMRDLLATAVRVAGSGSSVLILGETGVGKEWLARRLHAASPRSSAPFVEVNCAALPEGLLESELFGHVEGAFTGAVRARRGFFELAHDATLFLDEIGEMQPSLQSKLLRVLEDGVVRPVGSEDSLRVDVRLIAATSRDLGRAREDGRFRDDLYYRLAVVTLRVPPLRERVADIVPLAELHLERLRRRSGRPRLHLAQEAQEALAAYAWPGNVRELINVVERATVLAQGEEIAEKDLALDRADVMVTHQGRRADLTLAAELISLPLPEARRRAISRFERDYLAEQLRATGGRIGLAAARAGLGPRSLHAKMKRYHLRKEDFR